MGTRETDQPPLWIATSDLPTSPGHPFYARLTTLLDGHHFDRFVEGLCDRFYAPVMGRPSLAPGRYFRLLLVGYFEGIDSERGMAWRATDSLAVRSFLRLAVDEAPPDHSTMARTRRLIDLETHRTVFTWVQQRLVEAGRLTGKTIAIDATTLEANAAMRSVPYPLGSFYGKGLDGRIDDPSTGWKGRAIWTTSGSRAPFHAEGGKESVAPVFKFQVRPDPLAH